MASSLNVNGEWKDIADISVKANDEWKQVYTTFAKVNDEWKKVYSIAPLFDFAVAIDAASGMYISELTDMSTWTYANVLAPTSGNAYFPSKGFDGSKYFVVGSAWSYFYTSDDGYLWRNIGVDSNQNISTIASSPYSARIEGGNGRLFAIRVYGTPHAAYSDDGISWTPLTLPSDGVDENAYYAYGNGMHIIYGSMMGITYNTYKYSTDNGVTWQIGNFALSKQWDKMIFDGTKFVVMERGGTAIQYSADGINWQTAYHSGSGQMFNFFYIKSLNRYVVITSNNPYGFLHSSDLTTWTGGSLPGDALYASFLRITNNAFLFDSYVTFDLVNWNNYSSAWQLQSQVLLSNPY